MAAQGWGRAPFSGFDVSKAGEVKGCSRKADCGDACAKAGCGAWAKAACGDWAKAGCAKAGSGA